MQIVSSVSFVAGVLRYHVRPGGLLIVLAATAAVSAGLGACSTMGTIHPSAAGERAAGPASDRIEAPNAKTLYAMSKILDAQGKEDQAQAMLLKVLKQDSAFLPAYCDLARIQLRQGRVN